MNNETKVTGINILVKGAKITLTVDEARKLKDELVSLLEVKVYPAVIIEQPAPWTTPCYQPHFWETYEALGPNHIGQLT